MIDARSWVTNPQGNWKLNPSSIVGIAVHHSVTSTPATATPAQEQAAIMQIDRYHVGLDYGGIGYHAMGFPSGRAYWLGDFDGARSGVAFRNHELVHVCFVGTFTDVLPERVQIDAGAECIRAICNFYVRTLEVRGHNLWAVPGQGTICAGKLNGFDWSRYLAPVTSADPSPRDVSFAGGAAGTFMAQGRPLEELDPYDKGTLRWIGTRV